MTSILIKIYRFVRDTLLYLLSFVLGGLYLIACSAPYISPKTIIYPALLTLFFSYILLGQVILFLYWFIRKRWGIVFTYLLIFAITSPVLLSFYPINFGGFGENKSEKQIKVLSYNTKVFGYEGHSKDKPNPILKYIKDSGADLVCLQEASYTIRVGSCINGRTLHQYLKGTYPYIKEQVAQNDGAMFILLSKYPIKSCKRLPIKSSTNGAAAYVIEIEDKEVLVLNLHLESFKLNSKQMKLYTKLLKEGNLKAAKYIIKGKFKPTFIKHSNQAKLIEQFIKDSKIKNIIVCGDFNDTAISYAHHIIGNKLNDAFVNKGWGLGASIRTSIFVGRIDHILYNDSFKAVNCKVDTDIKASDHSPILTTLEWQKD